MFRSVDSWFACTFRGFQLEETALSSILLFKLVRLDVTRRKDSLQLEA
jgi:hypothetical protein